MDVIRHHVIDPMHNMYKVPRPFLCLRTGVARRLFLLDCQLKGEIMVVLYLDVAITNIITFIIIPLIN